MNKILLNCLFLSLVWSSVKSSFQGNVPPILSNAYLFSLVSLLSEEEFTSETLCFICMNNIKSNGKSLKERGDFFKMNCGYERPHVVCTECIVTLFKYKADQAISIDWQIRCDVCNAVLITDLDKKFPKRRFAE